MSQDAVEEVPPELGQLFLALFVPEEVLFALGNRDVGVHTAAVNAHDRFGQETGREAHVVGNLPAQELIELHLVGSGHHFGVIEVNLKLAGRHFRVVLLILKTHGPLDFRRGVDELAQRIERQYVKVAAGVDELKLACFVVALLGIFTLEQEALDLGGRIQGVFLFLEQLVGVVLEHAAHIGCIRGAILVDDVAEDHHLAIAEDVSRHPVECAPVDAQAQVAFPLRRKSADRRAVEGQVFTRFQQEFLVVVE